MLLVFLMWKLLFCFFSILQTNSNYKKVLCKTQVLKSILRRIYLKHAYIMCVLLLFEFSNFVEILAKFMYVEFCIIWYWTKILFFKANLFWKSTYLDKLQFFKAFLSWNSFMKKDVFKIHFILKILMHFVREQICFSI